MKGALFTFAYLFPIVLLVSCGGRPMSMAGFMRDKDNLALTAQIVSGDTKDSTIEDKNSLEYRRYYEMPMTIDAVGYFNNEATNIRMGIGIGLEGLFFEVGYLNNQFGIMTWVNAGYGLPCFGGQIGYSLVYMDELKFGPVLYYSKNEILKNEGEKLSMDMPETSHGYKYNELGGGIFLIYVADEKWGVLSDYKLGVDPEEHRYRHYFSASITYNK